MAETSKTTSAKVADTPTLNKKTAEVKESKTFTRAEVNDMIQAAITEALKNIQQPAAQPIFQVSKDEYVTLLYLGQKAQGTAVTMPKWGLIGLSGGTLSVPKKDFIQGLSKPVNIELLKRRKIIVVDGLTAEERKRFNLEYKADELLTQDQYYKLLDYSVDDVCRIFDMVCSEHKQLIAQMFTSAYFENNDVRVTLEKVKALNDISKAVDKKGMFTLILEDMGGRLAE